MNFTDEQTLGVARQHLRDNWTDGVECPCCKQFVKLYLFKFNSEMAYYLLQLYRLNAKYPKSYHIREIYGDTEYHGHFSGGTFAKAHYWSLIEQMDKEPDITISRTSGYWKITRKGIDFAEGILSLPAKAKLFNAQCFGFTGEEITISDALGNKFKYQELMDEYVSNDIFQKNLSNIQFSEPRILEKKVKKQTQEQKGRWDFSTGNARFIEDEH